MAGHESNLNRHQQVSYTPTEEGEHEIDVKYDGTSLPDTPFPVNAERGCDPSKVKVSGDGLEKAIVDEVNTFVVETKNAGTGELVNPIIIFLSWI